MDGVTAISPLETAPAPPELLSPGTHSLKHPKALCQNFGGKKSLVESTQYFPLSMRNTGPF